MLLTQTSKLSYEATVQSASQGPICRTFWSEIANYTLSRRRQLAGLYVLCACTKKSFRNQNPYCAPFFLCICLRLPLREEGGDNSERKPLGIGQPLYMGQMAWPNFWRFYCIIYAIQRLLLNSKCVHITWQDLLLHFLNKQGLKPWDTYTLFKLH